MATLNFAAAEAPVHHFQDLTHIKSISPYGLPVVESCLTCKLRSNGFICCLSPASLKAVENAKHITSYPAGATIFMEGQMARGVYIVCQGQVKLTTSSLDGKTLILKIVQPGDVLGMNSVIAKTPHEVTAETLQPTQLAFISAADFSALLNDHGDIAMQAARHLSRDCQAAYSTLHSLGLATSAAAKLAQFLLQWSAEGRTSEGGVRTKLALTHEEIAQLIGSSRETVTRLLSQFKKQRVIEMNGATLVIRNKAALENAAQ